MDTRSKVQQQPKKIPDEKSGTSNFPSVPPQDLHLFALKIRIKDNAWVFDHVPANPRFLVSSTDYPTIIQAGFHYNALHMAARWGNFQVVQLVLSSISSAEFVKSLYPDDDYRSITKQVKFLTDMYLNTPETGALETPLHMACKFNWYEVVKLLIGHPSIDLKAKNDLGQTAEDIIGTRREDPEISQKIKKLFSDDQIVPIWRDQFDVAQPIVGPVVNPKRLGELTPAPFIEPYNKISMELFGPVDKLALPKSGFSSQWKIVGYAGPVDELTALQLYSALRRKDLAGGGNNSLNRTPPLFDTPSTAESSFTEPPRTPKLKKRVSLNLMVTSTPTRQGTTITRVNQSIQELNESFESFAAHPQQRARRQSTPTRLSMGQYTPPRIGQVTPTRLGQVTPTRFGTPQRKSMNFSMRGGSDADNDELPFAAFLEETIIRRTDPEKGIERIARRHAKELGAPWVEHWTFLNKFLDLGSEEGLRELESYFLVKEQTIEPVEKAKFLTPISQICVGFDKIAINSPPGATPHPQHYGRRGLGQARMGSADREDWRLHSFIQFKPHSDEDDHEKEFEDAVARNGLLLNGNYGDMPTPLPLPDARESGMRIVRLFSDSSSGDSEKGSGDSGKRKKKKPQTRLKPRRLLKKPKVTFEGDQEGDTRMKPPYMLKYREKLEAGDDDSDGDSNSDEDNSDGDDSCDGDFDTKRKTGTDEDSIPRARLASDNDNDDEDSTESEKSDRWYSPPVSPASQSPGNESYDECFTYAAFVKGQNPSKYDDQLICAFALLEPDVLDKYPALSRWYNLMKSMGNKSNPRIQPSASGGR